MSQNLRIRDVPKVVIVGCGALEASTSVRMFQRIMLPYHSDNHSWRQEAPLALWYIYTRLHGVTPHKTAIFIATAVRISVSFLTAKKSIEFRNYVLPLS